MGLGKTTLRVGESACCRHTDFEPFHWIHWIKYAIMIFFSDIDSQLRITQAFDIIIKTREHLRISPVDSAYPGQNTGPRGG